MSTTTPHISDEFSRGTSWARALVVLALVLLAVLSAGCALPGLSDVTTTYTLPANAPADVVMRVRQRLAVVHLSADVKREGTRLVVRSTADLGPDVERELGRPSGLELHTFAVRCAPACEGPETAPPEKSEGDVVLVRRLGHGRVSRVVVGPRVAVLDAKDLDIVRDGAALRVRAREGTPAAEALGRVSGTTAVLASRGSAVFVGRPEGTLGLTFGDDLAAYERARAAAAFLALPALPDLGAPSRSVAPPAPMLAGFAVVLPVLLSLVYAAFVRRFDRAHPEPLGLVGVTFVMGALAAPAAGLVEWGLSRLSPYTTPELLTFGGLPKALPLASIGFALFVGLPEEGAKLLATRYATKRREFDEPVDGIVYAAIAALGFAAAENLVYFASGRVSATLVVGRAFTALPVHVFLSGLWGHALGERLVRPGARVVPWLLASAALHGLYDAAMSTSSMFGMGLLVVIALAIAFVAVLRKSLRHGPVSDATVRAAAEIRRVHAFGRGLVFPLLALLLPVLAAVLLALASAWEATGSSATSPYAAPLALVTTVIAAVLWGITSTLPLDAVVDGHGVTFAGAVRAFDEIDSTAIAGEYLEIHSPRGDIEIGPGPRRDLETLRDEIRDFSDRQGAPSPTPTSQQG
ncbi:MAG: PrsW family glutamic-type intramembrane protease [Polyangiaceae bacterium]